MSSNLKRKVTGTLDLGAINPVDEGIVVYAAILVYTGIVGVDFWKTESFISKFNNNDLLLMTLLIFVVIISI